MSRLICGGIYITLMVSINGGIFGGKTYFENTKSYEDITRILTISEKMPQTPERRKQWEIENKERLSIQRKEYREAHKDEQRKYNKLWRENNKEKESARRKEYYEAHKEEIKANTKLWRQNRKERDTEQHRLWRQRNKDENNEFYLKTIERHHCQCGGIYTMHNKLKHLRTKKHQQSECTQ